ncbi:hypothetical protein LEP48_11080 [Isoptericola sp. NEAU-Y5]|uniref:Uncharacterized protein n=1 Tax=Isoptericola luteus TaxID=2879484 RepID=A0ABS7ZFU6_9MICO|nr:hypothetical protein [Isoptericola sp. NEAU-Y5]MCA5893891.1 hypothetical protein [Isoptericola sp. NEAU-Y5]
MATREITTDIPGSPQLEQVITGVPGPDMDDVRAKVAEARTEGGVL